VSRYTIIPDSDRFYGGKRGVRDRLGANGAEPRGGTPEELGAFVRSEIRKWSNVIAVARVPRE
jgi:hypothetical protein